LSSSATPVAGTAISRRAARQKNNESFVGLNGSGNSERPPSGLLAAGCRDGVAPDNHLEWRGHVARLGLSGLARIVRIVVLGLKDDQAHANSRSEQTSSSLGHRARGLAGRDDAQRAVGQRPRNRERALEQTSGRSRAETGADNRHKVLSKS
jgi:hypothetical protein